MLVEAGLLRPETTVYSPTKPPASGKINNDGSITISSGRTFYSPSGAAKAIAKSSVNGWRFWRIKEGDQYKELTVFREDYKRHFDNSDSINNGIASDS